MKVSLPPPPPPSPSRPKVWAGITRSEAITEYHQLLFIPTGIHLIRLKTAHAQCKTFRAWKIWAKGLPLVYIIDEKKKGYWWSKWGGVGCHP
jgi:hypothetical protein